jgi:penicillin G amidase
VAAIRPVRLAARLLIALIALAALLAVAAYVLVRGSLPQLDGEVAAAGLGGDVVIERDAYGAVTITGGERNDVAYATGYVHAQDRWFQMDLARRMAAGRLAELVGDAALDTDVKHRRHRFEVVAAEVYAALAPAGRSLLESYARGANAGLDDLGVRPYEYLLLRARPEPWHAIDSLLVVFAMYLQLNDAEASADRQRALLAATLPPEVLSYVYSVAPEWEAPIDGAVTAAAPMPSPETLDLRRYADAARQLEAASPPRTEAEPRAVGSNNWAVGGAMTRTGAAIVANDMHLGLGVPNTWYRVRLLVAGASDDERRDLTGLTLPGAPIIVVGSNGRAAWGFTNSYGDWSDLVQVRRSPDGARYEGAGGWLPLRREVAEIRSRTGAVRDVTYEYTEWGPLLPAEGPGAAPGSALALAWTAHRAEATNLHWLQLETAGSCAEATAIANSIGGPVQNFVCADAGGGIGWTLLGRMPLRGGAYDARLPADWSAPDAGWIGWRAPEDYPRVLDPPDGRLWTANNRVVGAERLAAIGDGSPDRGARARQIRDRLYELQPGTVTESDMLALQLDDRALFLGRWRDLLLDVLDAETVVDEPRRSAMRRHVEAWTARASRDDVGYRLVRAFHEQVERTVFDALTLPARAAHADYAFRVPRQFEEAAWELATRRPAHLLDPRHADWNSFLLAAVDAAAAAVAEECADPTFDTCTWGEANATRIRHPLSRPLPALGRWLDMPREPMAGDHDMPHVHVPGFGASQRYAISPGHEAQAYFHMPGGQSGHPLSPYYRAGHEAWVEGKPLPFLPGPAEHTLTLRRAPAP